MSEVDVASEFDQYNMLATHADHSGYQLPKIHQPLRHHVKSKAEVRRKSQALPVLIDKNHPRQEKKQLDSPKKRVASELQRQQFGVEMEQKLKQIMQNVYKGQSIDQSDDRDVDFQEAIKYNKQKIKRQKKENNQHQRLNKLLRSQSKQDYQNHPPKPNPFKKQQKPAQDHTYDQRAKQIILQNKYLSKKKQIIAQKNQTIQKLKQLKKDREDTIASHQNNNSKDHSVSNQKNHNAPIFNSQSNQASQGSRSPKNLPVRYAAKSKPVQKQSPIKEQKIQQIKSSVNLFDNIHGLLQNPFKNRNISNPKFSPSPQKIKELQQKIRLINEKLGIDSSIETKETEQTVDVIHNKTVLDWKRIELVKGQNLKCYNDSNFEKEIHRVALLQEKNDNSFSEYLNNQKMIMELQLLQKMDAGRGERRTS